MTEAKREKIKELSLSAFEKEKALEAIRKAKNRPNLEYETERDLTIAYNLGCAERTEAAAALNRVIFEFDSSFE